MRNRAATWVNLVFASIIVIGVFVQAYLITAYVTGAGEGALDAHGFVGGRGGALFELHRQRVRRRQEQRGRARRRKVDFRRLQDFRP